MITSVSKNQWEDVEQCRLRWLHEEQVAQYSVADIRLTVRDIFSLLNFPCPKMIWVVDSPIVARIISANLYENLSENLYDNLHANLYDNLRQNLYDNLYANLRDNLYANLSANLRQNLYDNLYANLNDNLDANLRDNLSANLSANLSDNLSDKWSHYCGRWWNYRAGWFEGGEILGVPTHECMDLFMRFNRHCAVWLWSSRNLFILKNPKEIHWHPDGGGLHNEHGPAVHYSDIYNLWFIDGTMVNRQIVMSPETQSIEEIDAESNEEIKRIRIERFGVMRYIESSNAKVTQVRRNDVEATIELLVDTDFGQHLATHCPSTGRRYFLKLPRNVADCAEAQYVLGGEFPMNVIGRT